MDKLIKKILTSKAARNSAVLAALVVTVMNAGFPWCDF